MNTAQIITRYISDKGTLNVTPQELHNEVMNAYRAGRDAALAQMTAYLDRSTGKKR